MKEEDRAHCVPCPTCKQYSHSIGDDAVAAAFNHFQTMIAHPLRGTPMGYAFDETTRDAAQVLMTLATPTPVIETEGGGEAGLRDALVSYALQYGPRCRDCADEDGVCPNNGMGCGDRRKATEYVVGALMYGARHGFCPAALAAERSTDREALKSAVEAELDRQVDLGAGMFRTDHETGLWEVNCDLDPGAFCDAILALRPVGAENVRERALEEAAKVADNLADNLREVPSYRGPTYSAEAMWNNVEDAARDIADAIRALITPTAGNGEEA